MNHAAPTPEFDRVIEDVRQARHRAIEKGFTPEHDDEQHPYLFDLVNLGFNRIRGDRNNDSYERQDLIDGIGILIAGVEGFDRRVEEENKNG